MVYANIIDKYFVRCCIGRAVLISIRLFRRNIMFVTDTLIDTVQGAKKQFVNTVFANNQAVAKALNGFVDAQAEYTKKAVKASTDTAAQITSEMVKATQEAAKFNYTEAVEKFTKQFSFTK